MSVVSPNDNIQIALRFENISFCFAKIVASHETGSKMVAMKFSLLHHTDWTGHDDHFDLVLQTASGHDDNDTVLKTFSMPSNDCPTGIMIAAVGAVMRLEPRPDHRRLYLDYEGPVSNGRGIIRRVDTGALIWKAGSPDQDEKSFRFELQGMFMNGCFLIQQDDLHQWFISKVTGF
ncbi:MAG: hypothetical protein WCT04_16050 [Planctomycetota bacterium]